MSRLGSLYIDLGEPEGPLCGGCCEIDDWAADKITRLQAALEISRTALEMVCDSDEECEDSDGWLAAVISLRALHKAQDALEQINSVLPPPPVEKGKEEQP